MQRNESKEENHTVFEFLPWIKKEAIIAWVSEVARLSGEQVNWCYLNGRINIHSSGDLEKIRCAVKNLLPQLNQDIFSYCKTVYKRNEALFDPTINTKIYTEVDVDSWIENSAARNPAPH
jgi:hypothetical protein